MGRHGLPAAIEAILASIPEVVSVGDRQSACERYGSPKERYSSAACARRGLLAWSWVHGVPLDPRVVVYLCRYCDHYHSGRDRVRVPLQVKAAA